MMESIHNSPSTILILGNGFDLDLGLNTSYKAFIDKMYLNTQHPESTNTLIDAMIKIIKRQIGLILNYF